MTLEEFIKMLTKEELAKYTEKEIHRLFELARRFADYSFKDWTEKRIK